MKFLEVGDSYYEMIEDKLKEFNVALDVNIEDLKKNSILVDFTKTGYLL